MYRNIIYNISNAYLYKSNLNFFLPNPDYASGLHPNAPKVGWYTGKSTPSDLASDFEDSSFYQMSEDEIGHYLDIHNPGDYSSDTTQCPNNFTVCHDSTIVMSGIISPNADAEELSSDDKCMFTKLYCSAELSVRGQDADAWFDPQLFPNPTNSSATVTYVVKHRCFVKIMIYDILGESVKTISASFENPGPHTTSLGTEGLKSGSYICRLTVGNLMADMKLTIQR